MSWYNSYSDPERDWSLYWLHAMIRRGVWRKPTQCEACGQTEGILDWHREDYTPPFGDRPEDQHRGQFELCFRCHMMLHLRIWKPEAWNEYRRAVREGVMFAPMFKRNFPLLQAQHVWRTQPVTIQMHAPPARRLLDEIDAGLHCPKGRKPGNQSGPTPGVAPISVDAVTAAVVEEELALRRGSRSGGGGGSRPRKKAAATKAGTKAPGKTPGKTRVRKNGVRVVAAVDDGAAQLELLEAEVREILREAGDLGPAK